jgi:hypothetical protein
MDDTGAPLCALHAALDLGGRDGQQSACFEFLEVLGGLIAETGLANADDAIRVFSQAIQEGAARREKLNLRPVRTFAATQEAIAALAEFDRLGEGES